MPTISHASLSLAMLIHPLARPWESRVHVAGPGAVIPLDGDPRTFCVTRLETGFYRCECQALRINWKDG